MARGYVKRPLWICPKCDAPLVSPNLSHSCGRYSMEDLFATGEPHLRAVWDRLVEMMEAYGPVTVIAQKSRVVAMTRMRFAACSVLKGHLRVHLVTNRRFESGVVSKHEYLPPRYHLHYLRLWSLADLEHPDLPALIREAYAVGLQEHV